MRCKQPPASLATPFPVVPKLRLGTHSPETPFPTSYTLLHCSAPIGIHLHQSLLARIVVAAGITPMDRIIDVAALDRIVMNVVELLRLARPKVPSLRGLKPSVQAIDQLQRDQ
jgi:hypothetical protein